MYYRQLCFILIPSVHYTPGCGSVFDWWYFPLFSLGEHQPNESWSKDPLSKDTTFLLLTGLVLSFSEGDHRDSVRESCKSELLSSGQTFHISQISKIFFFLMKVSHLTFRFVHILRPTVVRILGNVQSGIHTTSKSSAPSWMAYFCGFSSNRKDGGLNDFPWEQ